ncbi:uncharacterized protein LOC112558941 [Pomacea canaliculata]|uniref:uncharacterized protein LOC112558941 n=1 Tax=Pomacea canaliculata TaxID=400727 RepID=UPI000D73480F|nr:uncharacterized protein LOC112558941 [Pomacea canaliculata]
MAYVNSGVGPDEADLYKVDIPGTNMHAYENSNPVYLEKIILEGDDDGQISLDENALSDSGNFEEQEVAMNIYPNDREANNNHRNRVGFYLKAAISENETFKNLQSNDVEKDQWDNKMMMSSSPASSHSLASPTRHSGGSEAQRNFDLRPQPLMFRAGHANDTFYFDESDEHSEGTGTLSFNDLPLTEI